MVIIRFGKNDIRLIFDDLKNLKETIEFEQHCSSDGSTGSTEGFQTYEADSLFKNRKLLMDHFSMTITTFSYFQPTEKTIEKFYNNTYAVRSIQEMRIVELLKDIQKRLKQFDKDFECIRTAVKDYKDLVEHCDGSTDLQKVQNHVLELFDKLKEKMNGIEKSLNFVCKKVEIAIATQLLLRYMEIGSDIFKEHDEFVFGKGFEELLQSVIERKKMIQEFETKIIV